MGQAALTRDRTCPPGATLLRFGVRHGWARCLVLEQHGFPSVGRRVHGERTRIITFLWVNVELTGATARYLAIAQRACIEVGSVWRLGLLEQPQQEWAHGFAVVLH